MAIVGFGFNKFDCVKNDVKKAGNIQVQHNVSLKDVKETKLKIGAADNRVVRIFFAFDVVYSEGLGKVTVEGDVVYADAPQVLDETLKMWESDSKLPQSVHEEIFKFVYSKTTVKALDLADALGLPSPIPLPKVSFDKKEN